jgi:hypothetical protein
MDDMCLAVAYFVETGRLWIVNFVIGESLARGEFQALKEISSLGHEKRPGVSSFNFICTHGEILDGVKEQASNRDKLLVREFDHPIPGFTTHPVFLKP